jgi:nuclear transport factor 2 (NTF2) superfamily protein
MEEFAKMIYEQWFNEHGDDVSWGDYNETIETIHDFLNEKIANELEYAINKKVWLVQKNAFIEGFAYACKCLSNGKVELKGGEDA